jgi:hypothetical protein
MLKRTMTVDDISGKEEVSLGGQKMGGYKGYVSLKEPSEEMKKVLSGIFR